MGQYRAAVSTANLFSRALNPKQNTVEDKECEQGGDGDAEKAV